MEPLRPEDPLVPEQSRAEEQDAANESPAQEAQEPAVVPEPAAEADAEPNEPAISSEPAAEADAELNELAMSAQPTAEADAEPNEPDMSAQPTAEVDAEPNEPAEEPLLRPWLRHYPNEVPQGLTYPTCSIAQFLCDAAERYPGSNALYFLGKTMTYGELYTASRKLAGGLASLGIVRGDRVAIMLPNCPQAVIAYYGVLLAGAIVVQTNPLYVERELQHQLKDSGAVAMITLDLLYARVARTRGEEPELGPVPELKHVIVTSIKDGLPFPKSMLYPIKQRKEGFRDDIPYGKHGVLAYRKLMRGSGLEVDPAALPQGEELAALQYTGGTTGTPKGVMLTHRNLVANTFQTSAWCYKAEDGKERFLAALPLFHVFGLTVLMNMSVLRAGSLILLPRFETETVLKTITDRKPTIFPGAPTMYVALINHANLKKSDLSSVNVCISGSAALPLEVQEQFEALSGGRLIEGFGLTEASPVTHANPIWGLRKIGTIGIPFPDTDAAVVDMTTGRRLPPGQLGELVVRGPQVMKGYWNRPEDTARTLVDGWLRTGDLATMDEDGYFTIMDRIKDVIIASGFNVYPREVEEVLFEHPAVREAAVIGVKDDYRGETVKAFIVLKEGWQVSRSQLDRWCRDRLAAYKVPHYYAFRETLPKTMIGKVLRRKLAEEELEGEEAGAKGKE
ncbi:AMP-binding protein [Paenibacillus sp. PL2-23]|uniref:long-chain-fatty-acid--CoA ligase n=1 Tax=Paenibacillus sp. PL2-23 TaxID=2100729 RepID=UPI0030FBFF76